VTLKSRSYGSLRAWITLPPGESARQGRRGGESMSFGARLRKKLSPVATASDPPAGGRVLRPISNEQLKSRTTSRREGVATLFKQTT
jgi:hypothetical protein